MIIKLPISKKLNVPAEQVWNAIRNIGRLDVWFPLIDTCRVEGEGPGARRVMTITNDGGEIQDTIAEIDDRQRRFVYLRPISPFPVTSYKGIVEVFTSYDGKGVIVWSIDFESNSEDAASLETLIRSAITEGIEGMEKDLVANRLNNIA